MITYRNLMLTMLLGGLWHGAAWTFVVWGGIHGVGLAVERLWRDWRRPARQTAARRWLGRLVTFNVVCFAWIFFRADSFARAWQIIRRLFDAWGEPSPLITTSVVLAIVFGIGVQYVRPSALQWLELRFGRLTTVLQAASLALCLLVIDALGPQGVAPFIYFRF